MNPSERASIRRLGAAFAFGLFAFGLFAFGLFAIACGTDRGGLEACQERARLCGSAAAETCAESRARSLREGCADQFDALMRCKLEAGCDGDLAQRCAEELNAVVRSCDRSYAPGEQPVIVR